MIKEAYEQGLQAALEKVALSRELLNKAYLKGKKATDAALAKGKNDLSVKKFHQYKKFQAGSKDLNRPRYPENYKDPNFKLPGDESFKPYKPGDL